MKPTRLIRVILLLCLLLTQSTIISQQNNKQSLKTFVNKTYKYQFQYPSFLKISDQFDDEIYLDNSKIHFIVRVLEIESLFEEYLYINKNLEPTDDKFISVLLFHSIMISGADGPDGSVYLEDSYVAEDYQLPNNLRVIKFYADLIREDFNAKTKKQSRAGPFYGIKLNEKYSLYLTYNYGLEIANKETEQMLESIVKSITFTKR